MRSFAAFMVCFFLVGCASAPRFQEEISSDKLFAAACKLGSNLQSAKGTAWLKVSSKDFSGQYSTTVQVPDRNHLKLTIDNILGGTEATILVDHQHYSIHRGEGKGDQTQTGQGNESWGGIPLVWATSLFLGHVPCPSSELPYDLHQPEKGRLEVFVKNGSGNVVEQFIYSFRKIAEGPWPESLHWERLGKKSVIVDFKFDQPELRTLSPKKWEAHSVDGLVKVIWRDRSVLESAAN